MIVLKYLNILGRYLILMGRAFSRPERMRMFLKQYSKEMSALGVDSIGIVLLISFFIGAVICIQMKLNIQSPCLVGYQDIPHVRLCSLSSQVQLCVLSLQEKWAVT